MSASQNLSQEQFGPLYHGTKADFSPGDVISPVGIENTKYGVHPFYGENTGNYTYATNNLEEAKWFADNRPEEGDSKVYEVEPIGKTEVRPLYKDSKGLPKEAQDTVEHLSRTGFRVVRRVH